MEPVTLIQHRGHCQQCGREQAVVRGRIAKHGYTVENGWFKGACGGHRHAPIEVERAEADELVTSVQNDVARLRAHVLSLQQGEYTPTYIVVSAGIGRHSKPTLLPFADGTEEQQRQTLAKDIRDATAHADGGESFAAYLRTTCDHFHGRPLRQVERLPPPAAPRLGERRQTASATLTLTEIHRDRVAWRDDNSQSGSMSTRNWRRLPLVLSEPEPA